MSAVVEGVELDATAGPVVVDGVEFDTLPGTVFVSDAGFDAQTNGVFVGGIEFDTEVQDHIAVAKPEPLGLGYRRATRSVTSISSPKPAPKRYDEHSLRQDMERIAALELADEEIVIAFLFEVVLL